MSETHDNLHCPYCQSLMQTGFLPVSRGMHFIRGDGKAAHHFAEDIPGTHAIMRSNRLLAYRCKKCEVILFKYGRGNAKVMERMMESEMDYEPDPNELAEQTDLGEEPRPRRESR